MRRTCFKVLLVATLIFVTFGFAQALTWEIKDAGLQDTGNFLKEYGTGVLNGRSDLTGDPGTRFNVTLSGSGWSNIGIGDGFDSPFNNAGLVLATGNSGDLSGYDQYSMRIANPNETGWFGANIFLNTGWTDSPSTEGDHYYQSAWTWLAPGQETLLTVDLSTVLYTNHVTNIGFQIGSNIGIGDYHMPSGTPFNVDVTGVPEPAMMLLFGTSLLGLAFARRFQG